jgi:magnesium chelatase family protein
LLKNIEVETSEKIRKRVMIAQEIQKQRFKGLKIYNNSEMSVAEIKRFCRLDNEALNLLKEAINKLSLSARSYFKTIKIAQTIADLQQKDIIKPQFIAEALQFRSHDE